MTKLIKKTIFISLVMVIMIGSIALAGEAPELAKMVAEGELPPLEERIPEDPLVVEPIEKIGNYGGIAHLATITSGQTAAEFFLMDVMASVVSLNSSSQIVANLAKRVEPNEDKTIWTIELRKGTKYSDGHELTTEDIMFWYEDILLNEDLTPVIGNTWKSNDGKVMEVEQVDRYTVKLKFSSPKVFLKESLVHEDGSYLIMHPKHYLKQYHINYVEEDKLKERTKEAGYDFWYEYFSSKLIGYGGGREDINYPTLLPYKLVENTSTRRLYERNPYFWKVDSEGNQLPYLDAIDVEIVSNNEVLTGKILSGEIDFELERTELKNYPMYKEYEAKAGYRTLLWDAGLGSYLIYMVNMTHKDPIMREIFQDKRFRIALSLGLNRHEINEALYFGKATPRQQTVLPGSKYLEPEFETAYIEYDPSRANQLLDEMGLDKKDSEGFRLRPDGKRLIITLENCICPQADVDLAISYWQELGLDIRSKTISTELQRERCTGNLMDMNIWFGGGVSDFRFPRMAAKLTPDVTRWGNTVWPLWALYNQTNGESGEKPPAHIQRLYDLFQQFKVETNDEKRIEIGKEICRAQAENLWFIGTIGEVPRVVIVNKDLRNIPEKWFANYDYLWSCSQNPSQIFFDN